MSNITSQDIKKEFFRSKMGIAGIIILTHHSQELCVFIRGLPPPVAEALSFQEAFDRQGCHVLQATSKTDRRRDEVSTAYVHFKRQAGMHKALQLYGKSHQELRIIPAKVGTTEDHCESDRHYTTNSYEAHRDRDWC